MLRNFQHPPGDGRLRPFIASRCVIAELLTASAGPLGRLAPALLKNADRADYGDALDTTAFQNKIGEHRHPQLRRPDPGTAGRLGAGSLLLFSLPYGCLAHIPPTG